MHLAIQREDLASPFSAFLMLWRLGVLDSLKLDWVGFDGDVQTPGVGDCLVAASLSPHVPGRE